MLGCEVLHRLVVTRFDTVDPDLGHGDHITVLLNHGADSVFKILNLLVFGRVELLGSPVLVPQQTEGSLRGTVVLFIGEEEAHLTEVDSAEGLAA